MTTRMQALLDKIEARDKKGGDEEDHSLRAQAMERAHGVKAPKAGTPHDWEDWEAYMKSPVPPSRKP